jgi:hypothetical protein
MLAPVLIVLIVLRYRYRANAGALSAAVAASRQGRGSSHRSCLLEPQVAYSERRRALVLIGTGLGLMAMFLALPIQLDSGRSIGGLWGMGLLPLMIGLGYLASWWLNRRGDVRG